MGRPTQETGRMVARILRLETMLATLKRRFTFVARQCQDVYHNQKHYLRYRAKKVDRRQRALLDAALTLRAKMKKFPTFNKSVVTSSKNGRRVVMLVTPNHARKLRALAEVDLRGLLNGQRHGPGRVRLARKGCNKYRVTE